MNDKDLENMMKNLKEDAKKFRSSFNAAVGKSTIRKTRQEKEAKDLVELFQRQTQGMFEHFKDKKNADAELPAVRDSADRIEKLLTTTPMGSQVDEDWQRVKSELGSISTAFGLKS